MHHKASATSEASVQYNQLSSSYTSIVPNINYASYDYNQNGKSLVIDVSKYELFFGLHNLLLS